MTEQPEEDPVTEGFEENPITVDPEEGPITEDSGPQKIYRPRSLEAILFSFNRALYFVTFPFLIKRRRT